MSQEQFITKYKDRDVIWSVTRIIGKGYNWEDLLDEGTFDGISGEEKDVLYSIYEDAEENRTAFREKYKDHKLYFGY